MNEQKIYPDTDISEITANAKKSPMGFFKKEYKKGDFVYMIEKRPFKEMCIGAVYTPTKKVFAYSNYFGWSELDFKFE